MNRIEVIPSAPFASEQQNFRNGMQQNLRNHHTLIVGEHGALAKCTALTPEAIQMRLAEQVASLTWKGWAPRRPVCSQHYLARAGELYWAALDEHVRDFVGHHGDGIQAHWNEISGFSTDLVYHSPPFRKHLGVPATEWAASDLSEVLPPGVENDRVAGPDGKPRSMHPITGLEDLIQLCRWTIYHTSFFHHWVNDAQFVDGGNIPSASLGMRCRETPPADAASSWPRLPDAVFQLFLAEALAAGGPSSMRDPGVPPSLFAALDKRRAAFGAVGLDIEKIRMRANT